MSYLIFSGDKAVLRHSTDVCDGAISVVDPKERLRWVHSFRLVHYATLKYIVEYNMNTSMQVEFLDFAGVSKLSTQLHIYLHL